MFTSQIKLQLGAANLHSMRVAKLTLSDFTRQEEIQMLYNIPLIGFFFFFFFCAECLVLQTQHCL